MPNMAKLFTKLKKQNYRGTCGGFFAWIPVNKPLPVINSLTLPLSNEVETSEKTNFTLQHKGFPAVFLKKSLFVY